MYAFNLLLIPVSVAGMLKSLRQAVTGVPSAFIRTPKVPSRTSAPASYTLIPVLAMPWMVCVAIVGYIHGGYAFIAFGSVNVAALVYALAAFISFRCGWEDVRSSIAVRVAAWKRTPTALPEPSESSFEARRA